MVCFTKTAPLVPRAKRRTMSRLALVAVAIALTAVPKGASAQTDPITFYGVDVPGDNFVWCVDRSCSMTWDGLFGDLQTELTNTLVQLDGTNQFGLVFFNESVISLPMQPALPSTITPAISIVQAIAPAGGTDTPLGLLAATTMIETAGLATSVVLVGDSMPTTLAMHPPDVTLEIILAGIPTGIPVHTYCLTLDPTACAFYEALAAATGGLFLTPAPPQNTILRGDSNGDGVVNVADPVYTLAYNYIGGSPIPPCLDAADADDNGFIEVTDAVVLFSALFVSGTLPPPSVACGLDTTIDALTCLVQSCP